MVSHLVAGGDNVFGICAHREYLSQQAIGADGTVSAFRAARVIEVFNPVEGQAVALLVVAGSAGYDDDGAAVAARENVLARHRRRIGAPRHRQLHAAVGAGRSDERKKLLASGLCSRNHLTKNHCLF